ncbi:hypothetical protein JL720_15198 [Aureococcus anophagefferens]|nr:hypothetical protein JL720_15198 [Aureococcus anophagefferens]
MAFEPDEPTALVDAKKQKGRPWGSSRRAPPRFLACVDAKAGRVAHACAHAKWHVIHGSHTSHNERRGPGNNRYLTYNETEGLNNQRIALENARLMAILLNRTLVVPDTIPPHDAGDPFPTKTCRVFTCDCRAVGCRSATEDHRKRWPTRIRDDAARCGDVAHAKYRINKLRNVTMRRSRPSSS